MLAPGYYKTNYRALSFREIVRHYGLNRFVQFYVTTRFMKPGGGLWMPGLWCDGECQNEELSEQFWIAMRPHQPKMEKLGYTEWGYQKGSKKKPKSDYSRFGEYQIY